MMFLLGALFGVLLVVVLYGLGQCIETLIQNAVEEETEELWERVKLLEERAKSLEEEEEERNEKSSNYHGVSAIYCND